MSDNKDLFRSAIQRVGKKYGPEYMENIDNWVVVHATQYMPWQTADGKMTIPTTAMATGFRIPRGTIHTTLNHVVEGHALASWDNMPYVIIAPFREVVADNGAPLEVSMFDTYFAPNPDTGLVLPADTHIVMPSDKLKPGELMRIEGNRTYYNDQTERFTPEQINALLAKVSPYYRAMYERWEKGDVPEWEIINALEYGPESARKLYNGARDKVAVARGMFEEARYELLNRALRDLAVSQTMADMGYETVHDGDVGPIATAVANTAVGAGMDGNPSNKGHSNSVTAVIEGVYHNVADVFYGSFAYPKGLLELGGDFNGVYELLSGLSGGRWTSSQRSVSDAIRSNLVNGTPIDFTEFYNSEYGHYRNTYYEYASDDVKISNTMEEYNHNIAETVRRSGTWAQETYNAWRDKVSKMPGYTQFVQRLAQGDDYINPQLLLQNGRQS